MTVTFKNGNMFEEPVDAIVNTVNCVGIMGKGVALEFKQRWPANFKAYKDLCDAKALRPGHVFIYRNADLFGTTGPKYLINFPTKDHWRGKSTLAYIVNGLDDFVRQVAELDITTVAMPPLGCGNGGLDWSDVKPIIAEKLAALDIQIIVFEPAPVRVEKKAIKMNFERAVLLKAMGDFAPYFDGEYTRITLHKLAYFLQILGVNLRFEFKRNAYGPYADELKSAFLAMEKHGVISGFSDDDQLTLVDPDAYALATDFLRQNDADSDRAEKVLKRLDLLIDGYESPYGMELLSSVHFLAETDAKQSVEEIVTALQGWNDRKSAEFPENAIATAYNRLKADGLAA